MITETVISLMASILFFCGLLSTSYYAVAREYVRFIGQEALVCMLEIDDARACEHEFQPRLSQALGTIGDPWIQLSGEGRKRKIARSSFRIYKNSRQMENLEQTLTAKGVLREATKF